MTAVNDGYLCFLSFTQSLVTWHSGMPGTKSKITEGSTTEMIRQDRPAAESRVSMLSVMCC